MRPRNIRTLWNGRVSKIKIQTRAVACSSFLLGHDPVRKLSGHSVYEQVGRRKLVQDTIRHGRFAIIVEQRNYGLNKAKGMDALLRELFFSYSVQDTMTVMHF